MRTIKFLNAYGVTELIKIKDNDAVNQITLDKIHKVVEMHRGGYLNTKIALSTKINKPLISLILKCTAPHNIVICDKLKNDVKRLLSEGESRGDACDKVGISLYRGKDLIDKILLEDETLRRNYSKIRANKLSAEAIKNSMHCDEFSKDIQAKAARENKIIRAKVNGPINKFKEELKEGEVITGLSKKYVVIKKYPTYVLTQYTLRNNTINECISYNDLYNISNGKFVQGGLF